MKQVCSFVIAAILVMGLGAELIGQETHPFSVHDMLAMERISGQEVSPDGRTIVFVVRTTDLEADRGRTDLWLVRSDGTKLKRLTTDPASDFNPRWSADGQSIFFLSTRSGASQVWNISPAGGEASQVTDFALDVNALNVSPDGSHLAVAMGVFPECNDIECTANKLQERDNSQTSGQIFDQLFIRHWDTWRDGRRQHLFVVPVDGSSAIDVMQGMDADSPSQPFGGPEDYTFTPDSKSVVFTARVAGPAEPWSTDFDLYLTPGDGSAEPQCLTEANEAWDGNPVFSPDGRTLAYLAMSRPAYESDRFRIVLRAWPNGQERVLTEDWDRSPRGITFSTTGKKIFTTAANLGQSSLFAINVKSGAVTTLVGEGNVRSPKVAGNRIVYGLDTFKSPVEIYSVKPDGKDTRTLTRLNAEKIAAARMGDYEQFTFKGWNEETVYGYIVKPVDFKPSTKYPVAFLVHGGPQGSFSNNFHYRWNPQPYAGAGYAAVIIDFHGSTGYGQEFTDSINSDWGGKPLQDLKKGLNAALARYDWLDGERMAALGASYGGYMMNWIAGNWPERFKCIVNHDGLFDLRAFYYDTEELWFPEWDMHGAYFDNPDLYEKNNPVNFVKNWQTPMLVVHSGRDYRVVETQGISAFTALQRRGIPSKLLYFPDENHFVRKPHNSILWHETVLGWLDQWLRSSGTN